MQKQGDKILKFGKLKFGKRMLDHKMWNLAKHLLRRRRLSGD
jgi:hypothetical protein